MKNAAKKLRRFLVFFVKALDKSLICGIIIVIITDKEFAMAENMSEGKGRRSYPRDVVIQVLKNSYDHPTAYTVYERAREIKPDISRGTVYRNLKLLTDRSEALLLETGGGFAHYDGHTEEHSHFVCKNCGEIADIFVNAHIPKELSDMGLVVTEARCIYYGYCNKCREKNN